MEAIKSRKKPKQHQRSCARMLRTFWPPKPIKPRRLSVVDYFRSDKVHHVYRDSFHRAIYPILLIAQIFGMMPVEGISAPNATFLHYKLQSLRTVYAIMFGIIGTIIMLFEFYRVNTTDEATAKSLGIDYRHIGMASNLILIQFSFQPEWFSSLSRPRPTACFSTLRHNGGN